MLFIIIPNDNYCISCLITEVINHTDTISLRNMENAIDIMKDSYMEDCLDQLILVVHLPDVSVTKTNDCSYIL